MNHLDSQQSTCPSDFQVPFTQASTECGWDVAGHREAEVGQGTTKRRADDDANRVAFGLYPKMLQDISGIILVILVDSTMYYSI